MQAQDEVDKFGCCLSRLSPDDGRARRYQRSISSLVKVSNRDYVALKLAWLLKTILCPIPSLMVSLTKFRDSLRLSLRRRLYQCVFMQSIRSVEPSLTQRSPTSFMRPAPIPNLPSCTKQPQGPNLAYVPKVKTGHVIPGTDLQRLKQRLDQDFLIEEKGVYQNPQRTGIDPTIYL
ncbi:hypothetical protein BKA70DRAFT_1402767 [Coprinopsis sp. MPI-PUGE-AT-0042]|nr:hypothetical protein BKA70DRAFT_1402767 [Coprinopsis sp. MPI-PUGE-AT-0042]